MTARSTPALKLDLDKLEDLHIAEGANVAETSANPDDELERFRNQWRNEVKAKRQDEGSTRPGKRKETSVTTKKTEGLHAGDNERSNATTTTATLSIKSTQPDEAPAAGPSRVAPLTTPASRTVKPAPKMMSKKDQAVQLYARAVEREQIGQLSEALMLYRKAFKLDDTVDRLYARNISTHGSDDPASALPPEQATPSSADVVSSAAPVDEPYSFQRHIQLQPDYEKALPPQVHTAVSTRPSPLTALLTSLPISPIDTQFLPANEDLPLPIARLPAELLDPIFLNLDLMSLERFALTCWRARYLTAVSDLWKRIALRMYQSPAMVPEGWNMKDAAKRHGGEWRTTVVEEERVRMDGCYISVCHYVRPGAGEHWVTITHMITYHRFLRFYPDGTVISFLTTDHPSEVVPVLRRSLRAKGLHFGRWQLLRSDLDASDQPATKSQKPHARIIISELLEPGNEVPKYEFEMDLAMRETQRGRWNKLDLSSYSSINLATGESLGLSLKHQKPFYFSKVKSYNPPL